MAELAIPRLAMQPLFFEGLLSRPLFTGITYEGQTNRQL